MYHSRCLAKTNRPFTMTMRRANVASKISRYVGIKKAVL